MFIMALFIICFITTSSLMLKVRLLKDILFIQETLLVLSTS
jgi:hypothetical protein